MLNPTDILGGLLQGALGGTSRGRLGHAMGDRGLGGAGGPLGQILGQLAGAAGGGAGAGPSGGRDVAGDLSSLSRQLGRRSPARSSGGTGGLAEAPSTGGFGVPQERSAAEAAPRASAGGGILGGNMRGAVGAGGLAMLAMLAMRALQGGSTSGATPAAQADAPDPTAALPDETLTDDAAMLALRAMIDAAKADGQIDGNEMQKIMGKLDEAGADAEEKDLVLSELRKPSDIEGLAAGARTPELAAQIYAAALLAIEVDTDAERTYLQRLAEALRLAPETVMRLHAALGAPGPAATF